MFVKDGCWDSIHIVEAIEDNSVPKKSTYKLTTTVMLHMGVEKEEVGHTTLSGSLTRQNELTCEVNTTKTHLANIGRMIEDMECELRSQLNELYILKTKEIVSHIHRSSFDPIEQQSFLINSLKDAVSSKSKH